MVVDRMFTPARWPDALFHPTPTGAEYRKLRKRFMVSHENKAHCIIPPPPPTRHLAVCSYHYTCWMSLTHALMMQAIAISRKIIERIVGYIIGFSSNSQYSILGP